MNNLNQSKEATIGKLREFFVASNKSFDIAQSLNLFPGSIKFNTMRTLHMIALNELEKETPDLQKIDNLLESMEILADK